jgi:hypothetical protein
MEKLDLRNSRSQIKIMGTLVSISGALIVTLYKGSPLFSTPVQSIPDSSPSNPSSSPSMNHWIIGGLFLATASSSLAIWNTAQVTPCANSSFRSKVETLSEGMELIFVHIISEGCNS